MSLCVTSKLDQPNSNDENEATNSFRQFDIVSDPSDHHYLNYCHTSKSTKRDGGDGFCNLSSGVRKKIMQGWRILEKNLPDSIFVRVYEDRIDLLRAVIIGAKGTPYHDGLYFFDIAFPPNYPTEPPLVFYKSFGLPLNPNLYSDGRVCLSLINTWIGKKSEKWNSNESTVLQVLVSIQALVLNEKPYFNEPTNDKSEKSSNQYNENLFVFSCKTTLFLLKRPPKNFGSFVAGHFGDRAPVILRACIAYVNGRVKIGYYGTDMSSTVEVSKRFKQLMAYLYPDLVAALTREGASLGNLRKQLKVDKKTALFLTLVVLKKKSSGVAKRVLGKLKKALELKKKSGKSCVTKKTSC